MTLLPPFLDKIPSLHSTFRDHLPNTLSPKLLSQNPLFFLLNTNVNLILFLKNPTVSLFYRYKLEQGRVSLLPGRIKSWSSLIVPVFLASWHRVCGDCFFLLLCITDETLSHSKGKKEYMDWIHLLSFEKGMASWISIISDG